MLGLLLFRLVESFFVGVVVAVVVVIGVNELFEEGSIGEDITKGVVELDDFGGEEERLIGLGMLMALVFLGSF